MKRVLLLLLIFISFSGCGSPFIKNAVLKISGSETMLELTKKLAEEYMAEHPSSLIFINGGGNSSAIELLFQNQIDIVISTRPFNSSETKKLAERFSSVGTSSIIAKDALCVYANKNNSIENISFSELRSIYTCQSDRIEKFGSLTGKIIPGIVEENLEPGSILFQKILHEEKVCNSVISFTDHQKMLEAIEKNENMIGIAGIKSEHDCKLISFEGVLPNESELRRNVYLLDYYLYFLTLNSPQGEAKNFIDWVLMEKGQKIIKEFGYQALFSSSY